MDKKSQKLAEAFRQEFNKTYSVRLKKYKGFKDSPWADRKNQEIVRSLAHPQISRDLGVMQLCRPESVLAIHPILIEYLVKNYGLSVETAESLVLYMATRDISAILPSKQIDGVRFFNDQLETAGPSDNKKLAYKNLVADVKRGDPHINIRIGRSATKQDVKWILDRYWDDYIAPAIKPAYEVPAQREKRQLLRNSTIYALYENGMKVADIRQFINDSFDGIIDESITRKVIKEFKPPADLFQPAIKTLEALGKKDFGQMAFDLVFIKKPALGFQLKVVKP